MNPEMEKILRKKIQEAEPSLDVLGADYKVLQIATQDLANYLRFINHVEKETIASTNPDVRELSPNVDAEEIESFLTVWVSMWLSKWKQRSSLLIGKNAKAECGKAAQPAINVEPLWLSIASREEMVELVASVLIKNSEICGTRLIAENILKTQLSKKSDLDVNNREQLFAFLNGALRKAHAIAETTGPIVMIRVDKNYYCHVSN